MRLKAIPLRELLALHLAQREDRLRLVEELVHALLPGARDGLVGGDDDALDGGRIVKRLQGDDELGGRAFRVGDDVELEAPRTASAFTSGTTSGTSACMRQAEELSITMQPCCPDPRRPVLRNRAARRHQAEIGVAEIVIPLAPGT